MRHLSGFLLESHLLHPFSPMGYLLQFWSESVIGKLLGAMSLCLLASYEKKSRRVISGSDCSGWIFGRLGIWPPSSGCHPDCPKFAFTNSTFVCGLLNSQ
ncbi:hypothetical protein IHE45_07G071600 [Dioscorea alata]|uniref:Uncharacterized protein n=2 Tax=Dioscorea alata TaxID=55571 RepID=A0ACB7VRP4_DIOAL|nr:hypothetical protein IHE45_07G071600 [Dioscorea alata]KAH7677262.1 hypothetical protein IHE45_07G071600 [Dioscorea alata]